MDIKHLFTTRGTPSGTKTLLTLAVLVMFARGAISGIEYDKLKIAEVPETLRAMAEVIGWLAAAYGGRRFTDAKFAVGVNSATGDDAPISPTFNLPAGAGTGGAPPAGS